MLMQKGSVHYFSILRSFLAGIPGRNEKLHNYAKYSKILLILLFVNVSAVPLNALSISQAQRFYKKGQYAKAGAITEEMLIKNNQNFKARKLLEKIKAKENIIKAKKLIKSAELEVQLAHFEKAYNLMGKAVLLDSKNKKAKKKYLALHEVLEAENYDFAKGKKSASKSEKEDPNKIKIRFLEEGNGLLGRKVKILTHSGYTITGIIVKNLAKEIIVYSESTRREFEIAKKDIIVQSTDKNTK